MLKIYNLKDKPEYIEEVAILTQREWGQKGLSKEEFEMKVKNKIAKIKSNFNKDNYCKLILLDKKILLGFISIFPTDGKERADLSPWYATMFVKEQYRGNGYSKILNNAILLEAKKRNLSKLYLKTDLENYYEKFGAKFLEILSNGEKLYYIETPINRISIIGGSGSGKTTLSSILSEELDIPVIHIDSINYKPNWVAINKEERDSIILSKANEPRWIIDGNYNNTLKERLEKADLIIWLDYSTFAHIKGVVKRVIENYKKEKPELPGCVERLNITFLKYILTYNIKRRPKVFKLLKEIPSEKVLIFRKQKDLNTWLRAFTHNENILDNIKKDTNSNK